MNETIKQALKQFGFDGNESIRLIDGFNSWEIDGTFILKSYSTNKCNAGKAAQLNALLHQENAPVVKIHLTKTADFYASVEEHYYTLTDKLPGIADFNVYEGDCQKRVHSMGRTLAKLHFAMQKIDGKVELWDNDIMDELHGWILKEVREKEIPVRKEVIQYCIDFADLYHRLPRQIIHRDPHSGNMCLENDEITGIYDFDLCQVNSRVFDLYYAFGPSEKNFDKWLALRPYFFSGYQGVSPISKDEMAAYPYMSVLIDLLFVAYWSTQNRDDRPLDDAVKAVHWTYNNRNKIEIQKMYLAT
jgi:Ser/Thr protein kinase RdoA (MazF antagonist)